MSKDNTRFPLQGLGVGIVALSGAIPEPITLQRAQYWLEQQGAQVHVSQTAYAKEQRFAGTDAQRLQALYEFAERDDLSIILGARGGYGLSRLLPEIDFAQIARSGKCLIGHSDFQALQFALLAQTGAVSVAGPMACYDFGAETVDLLTMQHFVQTLGRNTVQVRWNDTSQTSKAQHGQWQGCLWGGNLSVLVSLLGTPYFPHINQGILFLEDVNEHPYRIERMLLQLLYAGVLEQQQAIVLGDFSNYRLTEYDAGYDFASAIKTIQNRCKTPIMNDLPFGHCPAKASLPIGVMATLQSDSNQIELSFAGLNRLP